MSKIKSRKESVKHLIDESGNVQGVIFIEFDCIKVSARNGKRDALFIGFRSRYSMDAAFSIAARSCTDLWQYCPDVRNSVVMIEGQERDMGYHNNFVVCAADEERETLRKSAKFPFGFHCGNVLYPENVLQKFYESLDEANETYSLELKVMQKIAEEKGWKVV